VRKKNEAKIVINLKKKVKYAYQESSHSENTASQRSEIEEREREHVFRSVWVSGEGCEK
jgi:predicted solute-binding protein